MYYEEKEVGAAIRKGKAEKWKQDFLKAKEGKQMAQQIWDDGVRSLETFLEMIEEHSGSRSATLASQFLLSAVYGESSFNLSRMSAFDKYNIDHGLKILKAVGVHSADFRSTMAKAHSAAFDEIREKLEQLEKLR